MPDWFDKLQNVVLSQQEQDKPVEPPSNTREEWMILSDLHTPFDDNENIPDWHNDRAEYAEHQIGQMPTWVKTNKEQSNAEINEQYDVVDINSFSEMQKLAYDIVHSHFKSNADDQDPLCLIIIGVAGTGKSSLLRNKCVVTATTGKASYNNRGMTIHSLLKLPAGSRRQKHLTGETLARLQKSLNGVDYTLIDEYSMLRQVTFGWIDKRCKQAIGFHDKVLGGKSLILIGDLNWYRAESVAP